MFQEVVRRLHLAYDNLIWMKLSEIARYWAARELTRIDFDAGALTLHAPFACPGFTVRYSGASDSDSAPTLKIQDQSLPLKQVSQPLNLTSGAWTRQRTGVIACFDLPKGASRLEG